MREVADPIESGQEYRERWIPTSDGVELKVMSWQPSVPSDPNPIMFIAGWISVIEGWRPLLEALVRQRPVHYVETREKRSARIPPERLRTEAFSLNRLADDLCTIADVLKVDRHTSVWFGSSMGANAILEALKGGRLPARGAFLIGPNAEFHFPWWGRPIVYLPAAAYNPARRFAIWYLRNFRVDAKAEPDQMKRYVRTLNAADPLRLKLSARAVIDYTVWPDLESVAAPVAIAYASSDILHGEKEARAILSKLSAGQAVECESNTYMHRAGVVQEIDEFIDSLP